MSKVLIVDADSLAYTVAYFHSLDMAAIADPIEDEGEDTFIGEETNWAYNSIKEMLDSWMKIMKTESYELHMTVGAKLASCYLDMTGGVPLDCFRYEIAGDLEHAYKHNRTSDPVEGVEHVLEVMAREFNSKLHDRWEADDAVVALKRQYPDDIVLAAIDKDVLNQVPGVHLNYRKLEPHITTPEAAIHYAYYQCLIGDPGDGYKGVPGIGKAKAAKLIHDGMSEEQMWRTVVSQFTMKDLGYKEALATMRLANMNQLEVSGWPGNPEYKLNLWEPPVDLRSVTATATNTVV